MAKSKSEQTGALRADGRPRLPVLSVRFLLALILFVGGIVWVVLHWVLVRPDAVGAEPGGPALMGDLGRWNYAIGLGAALLGLAISAHPSTPLGRGRGVVVGMLFCFLVGLIWICTFYVFTNTATEIPVLTDLDQYNLVVGIGFMAVGFVFATRWE